jgi:hypothetical protein
MIPLSTTTIAVLRLKSGSEYDEPYGGAEPLNRDVIATGVRAVIDNPAGRVQVEGGQQAIATYGLKCDPTDLHYLDLIQEEPTGRLFRVDWIIAYPDHVEATMRDTEGES